MARPCSEPASRTAREAEGTNPHCNGGKHARRRLPVVPGVVSLVHVWVQGKVPWNKGTTLSTEVREKMSAAKLYSVYPRNVRSKMSRSHVGLTHSPVSL